MKYKARAECYHDMAEVISRLQMNFDVDDLIVEPMIHKNVLFPDVTFVFKCDANLYDIIDAINECEDCHVIAETVKLENDYTGERG